MSTVLDPTSDLERDPLWSDEEFSYQQERERERAAQEEAEQDPGEPPVRAEIVLIGEQMSMPLLGGRLPTTASVKFGGRAFALAPGTLLQKGALVQLSGLAVVTEVAQRDIYSASGSLTSCEQVHVARILDLSLQLEP